MILTLVRQNRVALGRTSSTRRGTSVPFNDGSTCNGVLHLDDHARLSFAPKNQRAAGIGGSKSSFHIHPRGFERTKCRLLPTGGRTNVIEDGEWAPGDERHCSSTVISREVSRSWFLAANPTEIGCGQTPNITMALRDISFRAAVRNRIFYRACERAGLHRRPLHATRHTFATLLLQQGESPVYVKEQMGHSSISVTVDIYKHWIPSANRDAVNRLPSLNSIATVSQANTGD